MKQSAEQPLLHKVLLPPLARGIRQARAQVMAEGAGAHGTSPPPTQELWEVNGYWQQEGRVIY